MSLARDTLAALDRALDAAPEYADPGVLEAFKPRLRAAIETLEREISSGARTADLAAAQAELTMLLDAADQSPKHVQSLHARIKEFLSGQKKVAPAAAGEVQKDIRHESRLGTAWIVAAAGLGLVLFLAKK